MIWGVVIYLSSFDDLRKPPIEPQKAHVGIVSLGMGVNYSLPYIWIPSIQKWVSYLNSGKLPNPVPNDGEKENEIY